MGQKDGVKEASKTIYQITNTTLEKKYFFS